MLSSRYYSAQPICYIGLSSPFYYYSLFPMPINPNITNLLRLTLLMIFCFSILTVNTHTLDTIYSSYYSPALTSETAWWYLWSFAFVLHAEALEVLLCQLYQGIMVNASCSSQHHARSLVVGTDILHKVLTRDRPANAHSHSYILLYLC